MHPDPRPRYLARANEQAFAPPYRQDGCLLHAFALPGDRARMQRIVDRFVAEPSAGRIRPQVAADRALVYFCDFARTASRAPGDAGRGWLGEREFGVWIPIRVPGSDTPTFFTPMMIVDSGPAMCSGREVLGFPKEIGVITAPRAPAGPPLLAVDVLALPGERGAPGAWRPLVEFERIDPALAGGGAGDLGGLFAALGGAVELGAALLGVGDPVPGDMSSTLTAALARAARGRADFLNLKQIRAAGAPDRACYRAIVRASARLRGAPRLAPGGAHAFRIHPLASHPLVEELGLPRAGRAAGLRCELDLDFDPGEEIA